MSKTAVLLLAEGAEEMEVVTIAGLDSDDIVKCSREFRIKPDTTLNNVINQHFDLVILPGGNEGSKKLSECSNVGNFLKKQFTDKGLIAAICAGPTALKSHGIAPGANVTSHPTVKQTMIDGGYKYSEDRVVVHDNIITSQAPGTTFEFALKLVELLVGKDKVGEITAPMLICK